MKSDVISREVSMIAFNLFFGDSAESFTIYIMRGNTYQNAICRYWLPHVFDFLIQTIEMQLKEIKMVYETIN